MAAEASIYGRWDLVELRGRPTSVVNAPYIELARDDSRRSGSGGCNRLAGTF